MMETIIQSNITTERAWEKVVMKYNQPDLRKSLWQVTNTLIPYILMWYVMVESLQYAYWITLLLSIIASGLLIRLFIIFHDCGHGSFFKTRMVNEVVGKFIGILTFTPYYKWHQAHRIHHATSGNLDKRGTGDVWTMTVDEYLHASKSKQFVYRAFRNPYVMLIIGPLFLVGMQNRIPKKQMSNEVKRNIHFTNLMVVLMAVLISLLIGFKAFLLIQLPIVLFAHAFGIWLFYVQHQFDEVHWERNDKWDYKIAAIKGSSFLKLPVVLQWFTGNIGFHHVHHLSSKIPNYKLAQCHYENELFNEVKPIRFFSAFSTFRLKLYHEALRSMVSFKQIRVPARQL